jgi:hypothetical protein
MNQTQLDKHPDRSGFDGFYGKNVRDASRITDCKAYVKVYEKRLRPLCRGGSFRGYAQGLALQTLFDRCAELGADYRDVTVLDCGYGRGDLSLYLACKGFNVVGVDISETARINATEMADNIESVGERCRFLAESLEKTSIDDRSVDFVVGINALHHFIKYQGVPAEFRRIMKPSAEAYFVDGFGENPLYRVFHDKEKMERLGDVVLNKKLIEDYFVEFQLTLTPTDWFSMIDKMLLRLLPKSLSPAIRKLSLVSYALDRMIPKRSRLALYLSGVCFTKIRNP